MGKSLDQVMSAYHQFAIDYQPFVFDTCAKDHRAVFKRSNDFMASYLRYGKVLVEVAKIWKEGMSVVDFGIFPGVLPKIFNSVLGPSRYCGVGLMFSPDFVNAMQQMGVGLIESELDPGFHKPGTFNAIDCQDADLVLFLDIVEHLSNPIYALDMANRTMKKGSHIIVTTDNFTSFEHVLAMLRGRSALPHPLHTSMFYTGEWRPHVREYAKDDLIWVLENSGFKVLTHEFFDRQQAEWFVDKKELRHDPGGCYDAGKQSGLIDGIKKNVYFMLRSVMTMAPQFRNHQIVVAVKSAGIEELKGKRPEPQSTMAGWKELRKRYLNEV